MPEFKRTNGRPPHEPTISTIWERNRMSSPERPPHTEGRDFDGLGGRRLPQSPPSLRGTFLSDARPPCFIFWRKAI